MADATDLKSVRASSSVWVRIPSSASLKSQFAREQSGKLTNLRLRTVPQRKARKRSLFDKYSPSVDSGSLEWRPSALFDIGGHFPPIQRDEAGNVIATHEHAGELKEAVGLLFFCRAGRLFPITSSQIEENEENRWRLAPHNGANRLDGRLDARSVASHYFGRQKPYEVHLA